jgi:ferredoxin
VSVRIRVDLGLCQGYACCVMEAAALFDVDDVTSKVVVRNPRPEGPAEARAAAAALACPTRAITVERD